MSSLWLQLKFLKFLPLEQFTDKGGRKFNFRCPICGDSQKSETKKRGWATEYKNNLFIKCFNCDYSNSFQNFLKEHYYNFYQDFIKEKFQETGALFSTNPKKTNSQDLFANEFQSLNLQKISELPKDHRAVAYLTDRMIPKEIYEQFYYSDNFALWLNKIQKGAINFSSDMDRRIVIPFYNQYKKIFAVQGRTIEFKSPKYLTFKFNKEEDLIFGLDTVDFSRTVFITEGPIDSLFIDNCLAVSGSLADIDKVLKYTHKENIVIIPDNDFRNKYTDKFIQRLISQNYYVVLWPKETDFKDINAARKDLTNQEIYSIIQNNTFKDLNALTRFKMRRL